MSAIGGTPAEGAAPEAGGAAEAAPAPDYAALTDRVSEIAENLSGVQDLRSEFQQFVQSQQPAADPEPTADDFWNQAFGIEPETQTEPQQPQQPALDPQAFQQAVAAQVQQALGPFAAQFQQFQQQQQLADLYKAVPQLADTPENAQVRQETAQRVQDALAGAPPEAAAWLSNSPQFIQTVFKAAEADRLAQAQEPAGGPQVLESGGATPGGTGGQGQSIVEQAMSSRFQTPPGWR